MHKKAEIIAKRQNQTFIKMKMYIQSIEITLKVENENMSAKDLVKRDNNVKKTLGKIKTALEEALNNEAENISINEIHLN